MNKKEEEIQRKLIELEASVLDESKRELSTVTPGHNLSTIKTGANSQLSASGSSASLVKSDGAYLGGLALIFLGLVLVFQHVHVGSSFLAMLGIGQGGFALLFLPIMVGMGMIFYNHKNKWGWVITVLGCVLTLFAILATLTITFPGVNMMQLIIMFLPFAIGGSLLVKGLGGPQGVAEAVKKQIPKK
jgi:hypothetical protein